MCANPSLNTMKAFKSLDYEIFDDFHRVRIFVIENNHFLSPALYSAKRNFVSKIKYPSKGVMC